MAPHGRLEAFSVHHRQEPVRRHLAGGGQAAAECLRKHRYVCVYIYIYIYICIHLFSSSGCASAPVTATVAAPTTPMMATVAALVAKECLLAWYGVSDGSNMTRPSVDLVEL